MSAKTTVNSTARKGPSWLLCLAFAALAFGPALGCSSTPYMIPDGDGNSTAPGAAFTADGMNFRKEMPDRRDFQPWEFYYKHCASTGDDGYLSKTAYSCSDPF